MKSSRQAYATVIPYGPDNTRATKLVVAIFQERDVHHPVEMRKWRVTEGDVRNDPCPSGSGRKYQKCCGS